MSEGLRLNLLLFQICSKILLCSSAYRPNSRRERAGEEPPPPSHNQGGRGLWGRENSLRRRNYRNLVSSYILILHVTSIIYIYINMREKYSSYVYTSLIFN